MLSYVSLQRASIFGSLCAAALAFPSTASARFIASDDFETTSHPTGFRTVAAGSGIGIPFYTRNATGGTYSPSIINDSGGLTTNVLNSNDTTTAAGGHELIGNLPENVWLTNASDFITLSFTFRLINSGTATPTSGGFRFGLHSFMGSHVSADGQTAVSDDDQGYYASTGVGAGQSPAANLTLFTENGGTAPIVGGTDRFAPTASSAGVTITDNNAHTIVFTVTRTSATAVGVSVAYDGGTAITGSFTTANSSLKTAFDEVVFGDGFVASPAQFNIDNISVTAVPEPATAGLIAVAGGLLALRRRRRAV